jgi:predicted lipoprotein with Yx(FWY)xxD motif
VFNAIAVLSFFSVIAVVVVALSKTGSDPAAGQSAPNAPIALPSSFTLGIADTSLGRIVVDSDGFTLYLFKKDSSTSGACNSVCTIAWQPLSANGEMRLGPGLAGDVGSVQRSNGDMQVTYGGHPLYLYAGDGQPGDVNGEGINAYGALWYAVSPSGTNIPTPKCGPFCGYGYATAPRETVRLDRFPMSYPTDLPQVTSTLDQIGHVAPQKPARTAMDDTRVKALTLMTGGRIPPLP